MLITMVHEKTTKQYEKYSAKDGQGVIITAYLPIQPNEVAESEITIDVPIRRSALRVG